MSNYQINHEFNEVSPSVLTQNELSWEQLNEACRSREYDDGSKDLIDYIFETKTMD